MTCLGALITVLAVLFEPLVLLYRVNLDFLLFAAILANTLLPDVPEPFSAVAVWICANGFEDDEVTVTTFAFFRHLPSSPS